MPWHPQIVHFPLALAFLLPFITLFIAVAFKQGKLPLMAWALVAGLQVVTTASAYVAMNAGEADEAVVKKVVSKKVIHEHEERAEVFAAISVVASTLAVAALFIKPALKFPLMMVALLVMVAQIFCGYRTGASGGSLIYTHGANRAFLMEAEGASGLLPTPGINTSESPRPEEEPEDYNEESDDEADGQ